MISAFLGLIFGALVMLAPRPAPVPRTPTPAPAVSVTEPACMPDVPVEEVCMPPDESRRDEQ